MPIPVLSQESPNLAIVDWCLIVQQLTGKFCKNCSLCDKSTKFSMAIDLSVTNDFKMGATSKLFVWAQF